MMIRINLLPVRQVKKREMGKQVLVLFAAVIVLAVVVNFLWYSNRSSEADRRAKRIAETEKQVAELEKVIGEVNAINKRKKEVEEKLKVLGDLRKGRSGPVRMLDALATAIPKKVHIQSFTEAGNSVRMNGEAASHDDVAEFMRSLGSVVWTPKGMGRLVEPPKRDAKYVRVELLTADGSIEEFPVPEVGNFFRTIDLKRAEQTDVKDGRVATKRVKFELTMGANYAI